MQSVVMLNVFMLNVFMLNVFKLNALMLNVLTLNNVFMLKVIILSYIMLCVIMPNVVMMSVIMLIVVVTSNNTMCSLTPLNRNSRLKLCFHFKDKKIALKWSLGKGLSFSLKYSLLQTHFPDFQISFWRHLKFTAPLCFSSLEGEA